MRQKYSQVNVLGLKIDAITKGTFRENLEGLLASSNIFTVGKINTEFLLRARENIEFKKTLDGFNLNIADGRGVLWAAKYLSLPIVKMPILKQIQAVWQMVYSGASLIFYPKYCQDPISENIPGLEAMYLMLEAVQETGSGVYFFGAEKEVLPKAIGNIKKKYPKLKISGSHPGFDYSDEEIVVDINSSKAKLLIVAMGSPKQEYWIRDNLKKLKSVRVAVGEGGTLDFVAGSSRRAPKFMQRMGIEWVWRLFTGVNRTGVPGKRAKSRMKRVWNAVPVFIYEVIKWKLRTTKTETIAIENLAEEMEAEDEA